MQIKNKYLYVLIFLSIYIEFGYHIVVENLLTGTQRLTLLLLVAVPLFFYDQIKVNLNCLFLMVFLSSFTILQLLVRGDSYNNYFIILAPIMFAFIVTMALPKKTFIRVYCDLIFFLAIFSLGIYLLNVFTPSLVSALPAIGTQGGGTINNAFFSVALTNGENVRNYGIAWEPGAFAVLLGFALFFELFNHKKIRIGRAVVITIALITTYSTMGYFFLAALYFALICNVAYAKRAYVVKKQRGIIIFICIALVVVYLIIPQELKDLVFQKLNGLFDSDGGQLTYTTETRINAIKYPFEAFLSAPFIGIGYDAFAVLNKELCDGVATNTIMNWFALFGLPFALPCTYYYLKTVWIDKKKYGYNFLSAVLLTAAFMLLVSTESLLRISLVYIVVFYGCKNEYVQEEFERNKKRIKENEQEKRDENSLHSGSVQA